MGHYKDPKLLKEIAAKTKSLREKRNVTLEAFYNDTGIHLARIESAQGNVTASTLSRICKYFGLSLEEFFKGM